MAAYHADVMVVVAYGLLLPEAVLTLPRLGCLNVHGSILPRWRGAAPIQRAIEAGDKESGVTIMQMDQGLDTGDMLYKSYCSISNGETSARLHDKLMTLGAPALLHVLDQLPIQGITPEKQDNDLACYAEKITKQEAMIDWQQSSDEIQRKVCAFNPFPVAYSFLGGQRMKVYEADSIPSAAVDTSIPGEIIGVDEQGVRVCCGEGVLSIKTLQIPNKKAMSVADLLNGHADRFTVGKIFGSQ